MQHEFNDEDRFRITNLLEQYFKEKPLSPATIRSYRGVIRRLIQDNKIHYVDEAEFDLLLDWRTDVINRASDITWNTYLRHTRAIWNFAVKKGIADTNPFSNLNWGRRKKSRKKTIDHEDLKILIDHLSQDDCPFSPNWFWSTIIRFLYFTGIRRKQLVTLTWSDIDFANRTIFLSHEGEKTKDSERYIPIQSSLQRVLLSYRALIRMQYSAAYGSEKQLFNITALNPRYKVSGSKNMTVQHVSGFFRRLSAKTGIAVSSHRFRHTMATDIAKSGKIKHLQSLLGHSDLRTTLDFYVHPDLAEMKNVVETLSII